MALSILFSVVDPNGLSVDEAAFSDWRTGLGDTVTPVTDTSAVPGDLSGTDLVVFGNTMRGNQAAKWGSVNVPVLTLTLGTSIHPEVEDRGFSSQGDTRLTRWVETTVATTDPVGSVTVYDDTPETGYDYYPEASLAPNAVIVSRHGSGGDRITSVLIPAGTELLNEAICPSRRAALAFDHFAAASSDGLDHAAELIAWLVPDGGGTEPVEPTVSVSTERRVVLDATASTGTTPLTFAFVQDSGPTVTITNHGDGTASFEAPDPWTENIVVTVTVTGDDTGQNADNIIIAPPEGGGGSDEPVGGLVLTSTGWR